MVEEDRELSDSVSADVLIAESYNRWSGLEKDLSYMLIKSKYLRYFWDSWTGACSCGALRRFCGKQCLLKAASSINITSTVRLYPFLI